MALNFLNNGYFAGSVALGSGNISMSSASAGQLQIAGAGYTGAIALDATAMYIYHNSSSRDLVLGTNETARITIDGSSGSASFTDNIVMANAKILYTDDIRASTGGMAVGPTGNSSLTLRTNSTTRLTINSGGLATFDSVPVVGTRSAGDNTTRAASTAFVTTAVAAVPIGNYLPLIGGTMSGPIVMDNNDISGVRDLGVNSELAVGIAVASKTFNYGSEFTANGASLQFVYGRTGSATGKGAIGADQDSIFSVWNVDSGASEKFRMAKDGAANFTNSLYIPDYIYHVGDTNTFFGFNSSDQWKVTAGGNVGIQLQNTGVYLYYGGNEKLRTTSTGVSVTGGLSAVGGMSFFETTLTNNDDWQNSPISINERANIGSGSTADKYAPNLNFHWGAIVSNSFWMAANGTMHYGSYSSTGIPAVDGTFAAGNLVAASAITGNTGAFTGQVTGPTPSTTTSFANKAYVDAHDGGAGVYLPLAGGTMTGATKHGDDVFSYWGTGDDLRIYHNSSNGSNIWNTVGHLTIQNTADDKDIRFYCDNGAGGNAEYFTLDGSSTHAYFSNPGNVGIGTTSPTNYKLEVNGTVAGSSFGTDQNTTARIFAPSGAAYNGGGGQTGYLIMELPDNAGGGINNMMSGVIRVFDYASGEGFDVRFAGYWYSGYNWTNCTAFVINQPGIERNFNIRFGKSTGASGSEDRPYIAIGDATSVWSYCKFSVTEYTSGHSNMNLYKWNSGWAASLSATLPGTVLRTISNTQTNNWKRAGSDMYSGNSGNVGIGTTGPNVKLEIISTSDQLRLGYSNTIYSDIRSDSAGGLLIKAGDNYIINYINGSEKMRISAAGAIKFNNYDSTNKTGTPTFLLGTDAAGNVVKTNSAPSPITSQAASLYDLIPNGAFTTTYAFTSTAGTYAEVMESNDVITATGTYSVQMFVNDFAVGGTQYSETYSGVMSWHATGTNDNGVGAISEIVLHRAGHAAQSGAIYLRTRETTAPDNVLKLEIMCNKTYTSASNVVFKFVRLI